MKKLTAAQQKVIDSIKASAAKFAGKTYEEAYPRVEDRDRWTKRVYENAQKGRYLVEAHPNTIASLVKAGIIDREGNSLFYWLVGDKKEEETMNTTITNTVTYHGKQVPIYGGAWNDSMNSCFYDVIGSVKGYDICRSTADGTIFALSNPMAEDEKEEDTMETTLFEIIKATAHTTDQTIIEKIAARILDQYGENVTEAKATNATIEIMQEMGLRTAEVGDKVKMGGTTYTIAKIHYAQLFQSSYKPCSDDGWIIEFIDTNGGYHYWKQYLDGGEFIKATADNNTTTNNEEEDTTMKTTNTSNPVTIDLTEGVAKFELNGITYKYCIDSKRYAKTTPDDKTKRIGKAEYEAAKVEYDQQVLDDQPSRVEIENDLDKPAVLNENGLVDCSKCNCDKCVHRDCMRRNPRNVGGLGECPRLDNGIMGEGQKIAEEEGIEPAEAELEANARAEQKKPRKARKSKDIAYEGHDVTLTAKQVDFLLDLKMTDQWEGLESKLWTDVICDEIEGQFAGKPMTVGAMISTLCEKGLAERFKGEFTDPVTNRTRKSTYMELTSKGWEIVKELGL